MRTLPGFSNYGKELQTAFTEFEGEGGARFVGDSGERRKLCDVKKSYAASCHSRNLQVDFEIRLAEWANALVRMSLKEVLLT
ncbi:MAG: hypothetical protein NTV43_04430 [Methylococcales bacterium]|nr:hypothetical protein [Methylococcales bacterium]